VKTDRCLASVEIDPAGTDYAGAVVTFNVVWILGIKVSAGKPIVPGIGAEIAVFVQMILHGWVTQALA